MSRALRFLSAVVLLTAAAACLRPAPTLEEAYQAARLAPATPAVQVASWRELLRHHPESPYTLEAADALERLLAQELDRPGEVRDILQDLLARVVEPRTRRGLQRRLARILAVLKDAEGLRHLVAEVSGERTPGFGEFLALLEASVDGEAWSLTLDLADRALPLTTPEAYSAEFPDRGLEPGEVARITGRRRAMVLAARGRAQANLGNPDEALATFAQAAAGAPRSYLGVLDPPLPRYWGLTLLEAGRPQEALEQLAPAALMGGDPDAMPALREAFAATGHEDQEFERFSRQTREGLARTLEDFRLLEFDGRPFQLAQQARDQVVLLTFWFPT